MKNGQDFLGAIRTLVRNILSEYRFPQKGIVTSYDPTKHMVKATLQPQGIETPWMQVATSFSGLLTGMTAGIPIGAEVMIVFEGGDINSGVVMGTTFNGQEIPTITNPGETKIMHPSGAYIKFFADGSIELSGTNIKMLAPSIQLVTTTALLLDSAGTITDNHNAALSFGPPAVPVPTFNSPLHAAASIPHPDV